MRTQALILISLFISAPGMVATLEAQIPVVMEMIPFPDGPDRQAYVVTIPMAELKKTDRCWGEYLEENAFGWESVRKGVHRQSGIMEKSISARRFTVYNEIVMTDSGVRLTIWLEQNRSSLVSQEIDGQTDKAIRKYIQDFALDQYRSAIRIRVKKKQRMIRKMERELASLIRVQENPNRAIDDGDYRIQLASVILSIETENTKMQGLVDKLSAVP